MNASRMRRPSAVRTGMFCRFGIVRREPPGDRRRLPERRVHAAGSRIHHPRQLVGVGRLQLRQRAMLEQELSAADSRRRAPAALLRRSTAVRSPSSSARAASSAGTGSRPDLLGRAQVERLPGQLVRLLLERPSPARRAPGRAWRAAPRRSGCRCAPCGTALRAPAARSANRRNRAWRSAAMRGCSASCRRSVISASSAAYSVARSTRHLLERDPVRALARDVVVAEIVLTFRCRHARLSMSCGLCDSSTYDSSSVSCATPASARPRWQARAGRTSGSGRASSSSDRRATARGGAAWRRDRADAGAPA